MVSLSQAKTLGGVGSILVLLTVVPSVGWLLGIVGFVMTLVAVKYISDVVKDSNIFTNMMISVILAIGAIAVGTVAVLGTVFRVMGMGSFVGSEFVMGSNVSVGDYMGLAAAVLVGLLAVWAFLVGSAVFLRRSYNTIASKLNVSMFGTAGLLYLIGAATTIVAVGFVLIFIAQILLAVSFFSINENAPVATHSTGIPAGI